MAYDYDPENKYAHRVSENDIARLKAGLIFDLRAACGKLWTPTQFGREVVKKKCEFCFPKQLQHEIAV